MATITPFLKLYKPVTNELGWDDNMNANLDTIDGYIHQFLNMPGFSGTWTNATNYNVGQVTLDINTGQFYECKVTHTSAVAGTFAADRAARPTLWLLGTNHAQDSATAAANSATAAATSAASAASSYNSFRTTYYGSFGSDPLTDPTGAARTPGDLYFNTVTQRLRVFVSTPTAAWLEITAAQSFSDTPTTPVGAVFVRTALHTWAEGVASVGGTFIGDVTFATQTAVGTASPVASSVGRAFAEGFDARGSLGINLYHSITTPSPPTGGWRYIAPTDVNHGAFLIASTTPANGVRTTRFYTTPTNEVSTKDGVANIFSPMSIGSDGALFITGAGFKPGGGVWSDSSDERIKNIIGPYPHGLEALLEMLPQMFTYKGNDYSVGADGQPDQKLHPDTTTQYIGLIAQECEEYMPELVTPTTAFIDGVLQTDVRQVDATGVLYALVNAVAELDARDTAGAPVLGNSLSNDLTMLPSSPTETSRTNYNGLASLPQNNSVGATGVDGTTIQNCALSIESHNGIGFQTTLTTAAIPPFMNGVIIAPRDGDIYCSGLVRSRTVNVNDASTFGLLRFLRVSATEQQIMMLGNTGFPTITDAGGAPATGGTGVVTGGRFYDTLGNTYTCTTAVGGVATVMRLDSTVPLIGPSATVALTAAPGSTGTGITVNLTRNVLTLLSIVSAGDLFLDAPNPFSVRVRQDPTIPLGVATKQYVDNKNYAVGRSGAAAPTTAQITAGQASVWKNTTDSSVRLYYNDAGTMKSVALT